MPKCSDVTSHLNLSVLAMRAMLPSALEGRDSLAAVDRDGKAWRFKMYYYPPSPSIYRISATQSIRKNCLGIGDVIALFEREVGG